MKYKKFLIPLLICLPAFALLEYDRAIKAGQKGNWEQSKELLKKVLVEKTDDPQILYDMGVSSFKSAEPDKALSYFTKASQSSTASNLLKEQAHFNAGNSHVQLKQLEQAITSYDNALTLNPANKQAAHNKEIVKKMLEQQKQEQKKNEQNKKNDSNDQEKQDQKESNKDAQNNSDQKENQKSEDPNEDKKDKLNQNQNSSDTKKDDINQHKNEKKQNKEKSETSEQNQQKQAQEKKEQEKAQSQESEKNKSEKKNSASGNNAQNASGQEQQKLSSALAHVLEQQEKKDAELNKKMIKAMAGTQTGASDGYNCW